MNNLKSRLTSILVSVIIFILIIIQLLSKSENNLISDAIILIAIISFLQIYPWSRQVNAILSFIFFLLYFGLFGGYRNWTSWIVFIVISAILSLSLYFIGRLVDKFNKKSH